MILHHDRSACLLSRNATIAIKRVTGLKSLLVLSALFLASSGIVQAQTYSFQELMDGASFTIPTSNGTSLVFQNFSSGSLFGSHALQPGQLDPPPGQIFVTAINAGTAQPGLLWQSAAWAVDSTQFIDMTCTYDVVTSDGTNTITGAGTCLEDYAAQAGANLAVSDALTYNNTLLGNVRDGLSGASDGAQNSVGFFATNTVHVEKEVSIQGNSAGSASLNAFSQTFAVTPEPGAWGLFVGAGLSGAMLSRRRRHRNSQN